MTRSTPRLSEVARHLVVPEGIVTSVWPRVQHRLAMVDVAFDPWQQGFASAALGCRKSGLYAASIGGVVASMPRQVGKTYMAGHMLIGLAAEFPGLRVIWTSHHGTTTTNTFRSMQGLVTRTKMRPLLEPNGIRVANGQQEIRFANGSIIMFGAREQGFGRGMDAIDVLVFDESQILRLKALEDMVPATNQAKHPHGALVFFIGTPPRPEDNGEAFRAKRAAALSGKSKDQMYVELSADPDAGLDDRSQWSKMNPSYPLRTPEASMLRMRENIPGDDSWRREAMGIWDEIEGQAFWQVLPEALYRAAERRHSPLDPVTLAVEVSPLFDRATIVAAGDVPDGEAIEVIDDRDGTDWLVARVAELHERHGSRGVVVDPRSPASSFIEDFEAAGVPVVRPKPAEWVAACGSWFVGFGSGSVFVVPSEAMAAAVARATKRPAGDAWVIDRRTAEWVGPALAGVGALFGHRRPVEEERPVSAYEARGLMTVR